MASFFDPVTAVALVPAIAKGLGTTMLMVVPAITGGSMLGFAIALVRVRATPILDKLAKAYISVFRGTPLLVQLFLAYFAVPGLLYAMGIDVRRADPIWFAIATLGLNQAAFLSEVFRSAIAAVDEGQIEAGRALGLKEWQVGWLVVLPQAALLALPGWGNALVILFQETSLAFTIGVMEVMGSAHASGVRSYQSLEAYAAAALIFIAISLTLEAVFSLLARRLGAPGGTSPVVGS
ncbi:amino acid ABC transporter permease [Mesorhizobium sp. DCY119]|uniref:amino acid ABC transporter permease n=1 Tax=Mesorhizobium sp. DCY119 TaxID=2108445 RepID=UPI000E71B838|nr:amino acid ABC transporter permease [Mesorhizobium sp. DCY119]RJG40579.1 amino acid ABC transporter permease [Mesorhizobium sp. DCY119]